MKVSIPAQMRHLFGNGSGTTRDRRKSTGTKDYRLAQSREHSVAQIIYDEFDEKLRMHSQDSEELTDEFAINTIKGLASSFNHWDIPELIPTTEYAKLESFKNAFDVYSNQVFNNLDQTGMKELIDLFSSNENHSN